MTGQDFTIRFTVEKTPLEVFNAINNVRGWWSGEIEGETDKQDAIFTYRVPGIHFSKQKILVLSPPKIHWQIVESNLNFLKNKNEWTGTAIIFEIFERGLFSDIQFTHQGLVPLQECYGDCSNAWGMLINGNLQKLINTGMPQPSPW